MASAPRNVMEDLLGGTSWFSIYECGYVHTGGPYERNGRSRAGADIKLRKYISLKQSQDSFDSSAASSIFTEPHLVVIVPFLLKYF